MLRNPQTSFLVQCHGWPTKKILGFRWFKKAKTRLETISFWWNFSINVLKFSRFLYTLKACRWKVVMFWKFAHPLKKREKTLIQQSVRRDELRKVGLCFITGCFIKAIKMIINHFYILQAHTQRNLCFLISEWRKKYRKRELGVANS